MPVTKAMTDLIGTHTARVSIAAGASVTSAALDCSPHAGKLIGMEVVFGASPNRNTRLEVMTSPNNLTWDTIPFTQFEMDFAASATRMRSIRIGPEPRFIRVRITNLDTATAISVWAFAVSMTV